METFKRLKTLPSDRRVLSNEELTLEVVNMNRLIEYTVNALLEIIDMEKPKPDPDDNKVNELAKLRANLKDFRPYG